MANITLQEAYNQAKEALEAGEIDRAVAICQHVLRYYPRYVEGYRLLGEAYLEHGGLSEAGRLFSHVLSCDPQHVLAHVGRAIIAEEHGLAEVAISELERGFEVDPSIGELRAELLRLYKVRYGTAGAYIRTTPIGLAYTHLRAGLLEPAIAEFSRIAEGQPDRWDGQVALLEALWRNEQLVDVANLAGAILTEHPNCVKANWILGYLHWTGDKLDSGRDYLSAAVALDPDYGTARKLWANTPWPLDPVVTAEQPALVPGWTQGELVMEEDLNLALPMALDEEPLATTPSRAITTKLPADEANAASPRRTAPLSETVVLEAETSPAPAAAALLDEEPDALAGGALDVILPMPEPETGPPLPEPTSILDTVLAAPAGADEPQAAEEEAALAAPPLPLGAWFEQWAAAALNPAPPPAPPDAASLPAEHAVEEPAATSPPPPAESLLAPEEPEAALGAAEDAQAAPTEMAAKPAPPADMAVAPAEEQAAAPESSPASEVETSATAPMPLAAAEPEGEIAAEPAVAPAPPGADQPALVEPNEASLVPSTDDETIAGVEEAEPITAAASPPGEGEFAQPSGVFSATPDEPDEGVLAPPAAEAIPDKAAPPSTDPTSGGAEPVGPSFASEDHQAAALSSVAGGLAPTQDVTSPPSAGDGHPPPAIPETVADSAIKENTMAPSYKEDDDQERQFEFDWEREGLPDYLKPFLAEDSGAPAAVPPSPPAPASPAGTGATSFGATEAGLPDWLNTPPSNVPPAPPGPTAAGPAPSGSMGAYGAPAGSGAGAGGDLDQEGLPDWLRTGPSSAPAPQAAAPPPPAARAGNLDDEGLPSWLQTSPAPPPPAPAPSPPAENLDREGLPSWLQGGTPAPPAPQAGAGNVQPFDFGQMSGVQPFDFGAPPAAPVPASPGPGHVQPFDFDQVGGDLGGVQPFDFGAGTTPASPAPGAGSVEPFDFGQMGGVQPFDFNAPPTAPAAASPGGPGTVQPFDFGQMSGDLGSVQPFDFGTPTAPPQPGVQPFEFGATAPPPGQAGDLSNIQPFDFGQLGGQPAQFGTGAGAAPPGDLGNIQPFDFSATAPPAQPGGWGTATPVDEVEDFLDYLSASEDTARAGVGTSLPPPEGVQPFAFDHLDYQATMPPAPPAPPVPMPPPPTDVAPFNPEEFNFQPFSFGQEAPATGQSAPAAFGTGGATGLEGLPDIQPFSFEDMHLDLPAGAAGGSGSFGRRAGDHAGSAFEEEEEEEESRGYSWQRPSGGTPPRRTRPQEEPSEPAGESIFAKARRRKEELEAAMRAAATPEPEAATPVPETPEALEPADLWPTFDEEEGAAAAAVPAEPALPLATVNEAAAAVEAFDLSTLETGSAGDAESAGAFDLNEVQPFDVSAFTAEPETPAFDFTSLDAPQAAEPVPATPPGTASEAFGFGDLGGGTAEEPVTATPDLTPGQPEQLWSVPVESAAAALGTGEAFDFTGLPRFDLAEMGLTPEEQAYLLNDNAVVAAAATEAAPAPAQPAPAGEPEALPSWLSGEAAPAPAMPEPLAELESNALPSWMGGIPTSAAGEAAPETRAEPWTAPTFGEPEPVAAEAFGEEDMQAWPAPAEPPAPAREEEAALAPAEEAPAVTPTAPAFTAPPALDLAPTLEERMAPATPALRFSGEPEPAEEIRYNPPLPPVAAPLEAAPLRPAASLAAPSAPARESVDDLLTHLQEQPTDVAARLVLAGVYEEREDYPRALDQYRLLIQSREVPGHVLDLVLDNLRTLAEDMPDDPTVHRVLGDAYRKAGMFQAAISQYNWLLSHGTK